MRCSTEVIDEFVLGRAKPELSRQLLGHLLACDDCYAHYEEEREYVDVMQLALAEFAETKNVRVKRFDWFGLAWVGGCVAALLTLICPVPGTRSSEPVSVGSPRASAVMQTAGEASVGAVRPAFVQPPRVRAVKRRLPHRHVRPVRVARQFVTPGRPHEPLLPTEELRQPDMHLASGPTTPQVVPKFLTPAITKIPAPPRSRRWWRYVAVLAAPFKRS